MVVGFDLCAGVPGYEYKYTNLSNLLNYYHECLPFGLLSWMLEKIRLFSNYLNMLQKNKFRKILPLSLSKEKQKEF